MTNAKEPSVSALAALLGAVCMLALASPSVANAWDPIHLCAEAKANSEQPVSNPVMANLPVVSMGDFYGFRSLTTGELESLRSLAPGWTAFGARGPSFSQDHSQSLSSLGIGGQGQ